MKKVFIIAAIMAIAVVAIWQWWCDDSKIYTVQFTGPVRPLTPKDVSPIGRLAASQPENNKTTEQTAYSSVLDLARLAAWVARENEAIRWEYYKMLGVARPTTVSVFSDAFIGLFLGQYDRLSHCGCGFDEVAWGESRFYLQHCEPWSYGRSPYQEPWLESRFIDGVKGTDLPIQYWVQKCAEATQWTCDYSRKYSESWATPIFSRQLVNRTKDDFGVTVCEIDPKVEEEFIRLLESARPGGANDKRIREIVKMGSLSYKMFDAMLVNRKKLGKDAIDRARWYEILASNLLGGPISYEDSLQVLRKMILELAEVKPNVDIRNIGMNLIGHGTDASTLRRRLQIADALVLALAGRPKEQCNQLMIWNGYCIDAYELPKKELSSVPHLDLCLKAKWDDFQKEFGWSPEEKIELEAVRERCLREWWPGFKEKYPHIKSRAMQ